MERRKDSKGRVLKDGESQRKDGIYQYRWTDKTGKRHTIYAKDLKVLREKENNASKIISQRIDFEGGKITTHQFLIRYYEFKKTSIKKSSLKTYHTTINKLKDTSIGNTKIIDVKISDAKQLIIDLSQNGLKYSTIKTIKTLIKAAFKMAQEDDLILKNPFHFQLNEVIKNDTKKRVALTEQQYSDLLEFVLCDRVFRKYYDDIVFLYETGIRVSEFCGLTLSDIDFVKHEVVIDKQLIKTSKGELYITDPKSKAWFRTIPLSAEAYHAIKAIINRRPQTNEMMVDGYCGFISIHSNGTPKTSWNIEYELREIAKAYNSLYPECQLPNLTPHVLRHTFCTRKVSSGMNIKAVQYLMGHSSVQITLDVYTSIDADMIKTEFAKVAQM